MSIVIASGEVISRSPINTSKSKQMYSFPKTARFDELKKANGPEFYSLPSMLSARATSFGFGKKSDFTSSRKEMKGCFGYNPTDFDTKKPRSPAYTFGISRQYYEKVYNEAEFYHDKNFPGPGSYKHTKPFGSEAMKFSFLGRLENKMLGSKLNVPGPGTYPQLGIRAEGKYMFSKYKNTMGIIWSSSKEKRFRYREANKNIPGPGNYEIKPLITGQGTIFNSKYKSNMGKTIAGKFLEPTSKLKTPGPGSYRVFSEFGIYESKHAKAEETIYAKTESNFYSSKKLIDSNNIGTNSILNTDYTEKKR